MPDSVAASCDVLAIGHDPAVLAAALDCARIGLRVQVWIVGEVPPTDTFTHRGGLVADFLTEWGVPFEVQLPAAGAAQVCGIPANPFAPQVRAALGSAGMWRVYLDRLLPVLRIGSDSNLGELVRRRLGTAALQRVVNPVLLERYGLTADELTVDAVAPGLNQGMSRSGSLTNGVVELMVEDPRVVQAVVVPGGMPRIMEELRAKLEYFAAEVHEVGEVDDVVAAGSTWSALLYDDQLVGPEALARLNAGAGGGAQASLEAAVGISPARPGLERAVPAARAAALSLRRALLAQPGFRPLGPVVDSE
jgi:hypothetical protein